MGLEYQVGAGSQVTRSLPEEREGGNGLFSFHYIPLVFFGIGLFSFRYIPLLFFKMFIYLLGF